MGTIPCFHGVPLTADRGIISDSMPNGLHDYRPESKIQVTRVLGPCDSIGLIEE